MPDRTEIDLELTTCPPEIFIDIAGAGGVGIKGRGRNLLEAVEEAFQYLTGDVVPLSDLKGMIKIIDLKLEDSPFITIEIKL